MSRIELSGGEIEYTLIAGAAALPPLVLLHEGLGCMAAWRRFPYRLAAATGRAVLVYSRYGYGYSAPARLPRGLDYMHVEADQVLPELLERLQLRAPVLIGHSDGASIAMLHASEHSVSALALLAPHVFVEELTLAGIGAAQAAFQRGELGRQLAFYHREPDAVFLGWSGVWTRPGFRAWNIEACLPGIAAPTLLLQGREDEYGTLAQFDAIERGLGAATYRHHLPDCAHSPHLQQPETTLAYIVDFLTQAATAAGGRDGRQLIKGK